MLCVQLHIITQVGIEPEDVNAEVLPSHKRNQILSYQEGKKKVMRNERYPTC